MKTLQKLVALSLLLAAPLLSRAQSNNPTTFDDVKQSSKDAAVTAGHYTEQQIKEFDKAAEKQYHALGKKLDDMKANAQTQTGQARVDMDKKIAEAQKKLDDLKPKLHELKTAATNAWGDVKSAFDNGIQDLEKTFQ
jgi:predicted  nucleic acid-binding Zn-ribbon protein